MSILKNKTNKNKDIFLKCPECFKWKKVELNDVNFSCNKCDFGVFNFSFQDPDLNNLRDKIRRVHNTKKQAEIIKKIKLICSSECFNK